MYPVYETDFSVRTETEELPALPEFPTAAGNSEFVAQLEELMGPMNPSSYGPTEPNLWLVGKIPPKNWENCRWTSERKSRTHSYDELIDLLMELAMERENDSHMDKYLRKHLRRETPAERKPGRRSSQPNSNPGKGRGGHLKHMQETPPSNGKGVSNLECQMHECIDAGLVEEYKHGDYPRHCSPCFVVAKLGTTAMCLVTRYRGGPCPRSTLGGHAKQAGKALRSGHPHRTKRSTILATLQRKNESMYNNNNICTH